MPGMDIFNQDAFSMVSLTSAVNEQPHVPSLLRNMGLFRQQGIRTTTVAIEKKGTTLSLVQTSPRGAPPEQRTRDKRDIRNLTVPRLAKEAVVYAEQVQGVRAFGSETELETVMSVVNQELEPVRTEIDMTEENHLLGAVKGIVTDADGSTIHNLFTEFGVTQLAEFDFELDDANTDVRAKNSALRRLMAKELKIGAMPFRVAALCGDAFFDAYVNHDSVKEAWQRWNDGQALREDFTYERFVHGGVELINYRGSDDDAVTVPTDKAHFFPVGVPGLFELVYAPADTMETVNTIGLPRYVLPGQDPSGKDRYRSFEVQSNPLAYCTRPKTLIKAKRA